MGLSLIAQLPSHYCGLARTPIARPYVLYIIIFMFRLPLAWADGVPERYLECLHDTDCAAILDDCNNRWYSYNKIYINQMEDKFVASDCMTNL